MMIRGRLEEKQTATQDAPSERGSGGGRGAGNDGEGRHPRLSGIRTFVSISQTTRYSYINRHNTTQ